MDSLNKFLLVELKLAEAYEAGGNFPEALWWYRAVAAQAQSDTLEEIRFEVERRIEEITEKRSRNETGRSFRGEEN